VDRVFLAQTIHEITRGSGAATQPAPEKQIFTGLYQELKQETTRNSTKRLTLVLRRNIVASPQLNSKVLAQD
jgi:hypothetical protein